MFSYQSFVPWDAFLPCLDHMRHRTNSFLAWSLASQIWHSFSFPSLVVTVLEGRFTITALTARELFILLEWASSLCRQMCLATYISKSSAWIECLVNLLLLPSPITFTCPLCFLRIDSLGKMYTPCLFIWIAISSKKWMEAKEVRGEEQNKPGGRASFHEENEVYWTRHPFASPALLCDSEWD